MIVPAAELPELKFSIQAIRAPYEMLLPVEVHAYQAPGAATMFSTVAPTAGDEETKPQTRGRSVMRVVFLVGFGVHTLHRLWIISVTEVGAAEANGSLENSMRGKAPVAADGV